MRTKTALIEEKEGVVILRIDDKITEDMDDVKANLAVIDSVATDPLEIRVLVIPGNGGGINPEAREFVTKYMRKYGAVGFISDSLAKYLIVNHISRMMGNKRVRVFKSEEKALFWLKSMVVGPVLA